MEARFDYYAATFSHPPQVLADLLSGVCGAERVGMIRPRHYQQGERWEAPTGFRATLQYGGASERAYVEADGFSGHLLSKAIRANLPEHRVTRADACIDWIERDGWDRWAPVMGDVGRRYRVKPGRRDGDWDNTQGRTYYLGSETSVVRMRLYEKGMQMFDEARRAGGKLAPEAQEVIAALPEGAVLSDLNRLEVQVRPNSAEAKERMARVEPLGFFGASKWASDVLAVITRSQVQQLAGLGTVRRESDHRRAVSVMVKQYHRHLSLMAGELGGFAQLGEFIETEIRNLAERSAQLKSHRRGSGGG